MKNESDVWHNQSNWWCRKMSHPKIHQLMIGYIFAKGRWGSLQEGFWSNRCRTICQTSVRFWCCFKTMKLKEFQIDIAKIQCISHTWAKGLSGQVNLHLLFWQQRWMDLSLFASLRLYSSWNVCKIPQNLQKYF